MTFSLYGITDFQVQYLTEGVWVTVPGLYTTALSPDPDQLSALAKEIHLDSAAFDGCLASGKYKAAVQKDFEQGQELGVSATPAFFISAVSPRTRSSFERSSDKITASTSEPEA